MRKGEKRSRKQKALLIIFFLIYFYFQFLISPSLLSSANCKPSEVTHHFLFLSGF